MAITGSQPSYMYALGGYARGGATRGGDTDPQTYITIGGVQVGALPAVDAQHVVDGTLSIAETEGETANTASFQVIGFQPTDGQEVIMTQGSKNNLDRLFAGTILTDAHSYVGTPANYNEGIHVIDYTWQLTRDTFSQRWQTTSATVIAQAIIAQAAGRGITSTSVAAGLPVLDEFTVTNQTPAQALSALAARIGGYWKTLYRSRVAGARADVRFGITTDTGQTDPTTLTVASAALTRMENFSVTRDLSQAITRQPVEGGGGNALTDVPVGETILPVTLTDWYNPSSGGTVVSGPQRLTYSGVQAGGAGSFVGPGVSPSVAPSASVQGGGSIDTGVHSYAVVWGTAAGKTTPGPTKAVTTSTTALAPPTDTPVAVLLTGGSTNGMTNGVSYQWCMTYVIDSTHETTPGPVSNVIVADGVNDIRLFTATPPTGANTLVNVYRKVSGVYYRTLGPILWANVTGVTVDVPTDATLVAVGTPAPAVNTATYATVTVSAIALGPTGTTFREVHRTAAGGSQLKLLTTIANNTSTGPYVDSAADGTLGANAPTVDTSGLVTVAGQINVGSTSLLTAGWTGPSAGWAILGAQLVRYTGLTGNTLTGIPATGPGALVSSVKYGDHVDPAPALTGIPASGAGSILYLIKQGDPVNLRVVIDDLSAQAVIAAMMLPTVDDGIIEGAVIQDGRISETEARARGTAQLLLRSAIDVAVAFDTRDKNVHASRTAGVNLPSPTSVVGTFKLQSVTIDTFTPAQWPIAHAHGANKRFTLEDLLRIARGA